MDHQPDKLFRDKLQDYQKPASGEAWNRIAANVHKKNKLDFWFKAAASILLLAVAGILLFPIQDKPATDIIAEKAIAPEKKESSGTNEIAPSENLDQPSLEEKKTTQPVTPGTKNQTVRREYKKPVVAPTQAKVNDEEQPIAPEEIVPVENPQAPEPENSFARNEQVKEQPDDEGSITLVYTTDEVNEKYLNKTVPDEATSEEKKTSTLKKLLEKAYDLKHNQDPLGELRQKKNEIFALNFKSDKQRIQNK